MLMLNNIDQTITKDMLVAEVSLRLFSPVVSYHRPCDSRTSSMELNLLRN